MTKRDEVDAPRTQEELELSAQALAVKLLRGADAAVDIPTAYGCRLAAINADRSLDGAAREQARRALWIAAVEGVKLAIRGPWGRLQ
jgi:hypothetical protein